MNLDWTKPRIYSSDSTSTINLPWHYSDSTATERYVHARYKDAERTIEALNCAQRARVIRRAARCIAAGQRWQGGISAATPRFPSTRRRAQMLAQ